MKVARFFVLLLMVVGSLNWGLVGFFQYDLVSDAFGGMSAMGARIIFALVGLAGIAGIALLGSSCGCSCCCGSSCSCGPSCKCCNKKEQSCK